jgi:hypothetical protein
VDEAKLRNRRRGRHSNHSCRAYRCGSVVERLVHTIRCLRVITVVAAPGPGNAELLRKTAIQSLDPRTLDTTKYIQVCTMHRTHSEPQQTRERLQLEGGRWVRFDGYELRDGYICPAKDAAPTHYDLSPDIADVDGLRPYEELAQIVRKGRRTVSGALEPETEAALLRWCSRFGLLGVLLQRVVTIVLPPRQEPDDDPYFAMIRRVSYFRRPGGWQQLGNLTDDQPLPTEEGYVALQPLGGSKISIEPLTKTWTKYFPSIPQNEREVYDYPHPEDAEFFRLYAEPIEDFMHAAGLVVHALEDITGTKPHTRTSDSISDFVQGVGTLNALAAETSPVFCAMRDGTLREAWVAHTLLAWLARMALRDHAGGQSVRICENPTCLKLFTSSAYQARYCSKRCRLTVNKRVNRRNRAGMRRKRRSAANGRMTRRNPG